MQIPRQVGMTLLHMSKGFSCPNGGADDCDVIIMTSLLYCLCRLMLVQKRLWHKPRGCVQLSWVSVVLVWEGHRPSASAILVPLMKQEYKTYREVFIICSSHWHVPKFCWAPYISLFELLVCQSCGLSPCICQSWYWRGKDHCHLELNVLQG